MQIKMTRDEFSAKAEEVKTISGLDLSGDQGEITHSGVTLGYTFNGTALDIEIKHKPFYVPTSVVESQISAWFAGGAPKSSVSTTVASSIALLLCCTMMLTGCTPKQQQDAKIAVAKILSYAPEVQLAEDSLATAVSLFVPADAVLISAGQATFDGAKAALIVAANAYIATPNDGALASLRLALENTLAANADQYLAAAHITNPISLAAAKAGIVAVRAVLLLMDGALQSTQSTAANVATAQARTLKLSQIEPFLTSTQKHEVEQATGHNFRLVYAYETSLGY